MARTSVLATLLFTDIVGSTNVAEQVGDRRWRELLSRHHRILRTALREHGGREVDTAGDGVFSWFDSPAAAVRCAAAAIDGVRELGIEIRAGVHIGDCEVLDGKPSGVNVHVGARTMAQAGAGEILVTGSVRDLVRGAGFGFEDRGVHELRGVAGEWPLLAVTSIDGEARPPVAPDAEARARRDAVLPPPIVKRRRVRIAALGVLIVALLAAGSLALAHDLGGSTTSTLVGCEVTQERPLKDNAFNEGVYNGLTDAGTSLGMVVRTYRSARFDPKIWARKLNAAAGGGCDVIVTVGDQMFDTTVAAAHRFPKQKFIVSDTERLSTLPNVTTIRFHPDQAAFEAGYLAAGVTKTGKVGTFGGLPVQNVTSFMDGFASGVGAYDEQHGSRVRVLPRLFVSSHTQLVGAFLDMPGARRLALRLIEDGADVLFPVDGPTGERAAGAEAAGKPGVVLIGVDGDQYFLTPAYSHSWLTSVEKEYATMVALGVRRALDGYSGPLDGTLANGGVGLAGYHLLTRRVPTKLRAELKHVRRY